MLVRVTSTVAILSILPFLAAVEIEASPLKGINPNNNVAFEVPVLSADFTELLVAVNPEVTVQLAKETAIKIPKTIFSFY